MKDKAGVNIAPGSFIVYGHALGRCAGLRYGVVKEVTKSKEVDWSGKKVDRVRVRGVDDDWTMDVKPELLSKDSYLSFGNRILLIDIEQMPHAIFKLLDDHYHESP